MEKLKEMLMRLVDELDQMSASQVRQRLDDLVSVYPFNEYEFLISTLMGHGKLKLDDYYE